MKSKPKAPSARAIKRAVVDAEVAKSLAIAAEMGVTEISEDDLRKMRNRIARRLRRPMTAVEKLEAELDAKIAAAGGSLTSAPTPSSVLGRRDKPSRKVRIHAAAIGREAPDWRPPFPETE